MSKVLKVAAKKWSVELCGVIVELCVMILKSDAKFEEKMNCGIKNDMKNLVNFHLSTQNSENLYFDRLFLSKEYVSDKKFKGKLTHERKMT